MNKADTLNHSTNVDNTNEVHINFEDESNDIITSINDVQENSVVEEETTEEEKKDLTTTDENTECTSLIEVKPHIMRKHLSENNINNDLEDIALCDDNLKNKINKIDDSEILQKIKDNIKYYETESENISMDVQIDRDEKNICNTCSINEDYLCNIF